MSLFIILHMGTDRVLRYEVQHAQKDLILQDPGTGSPDKRVAGCYVRSV